MRSTWLGVALAFATVHSGATRDVNLAIVEYRALHAVGQVRLTTGYVHDRATQESLLDNLVASDRRGIILVAGDSVRRITRRELLEGNPAHVVETELTIYPPLGHGYRGGMATAGVTIKVDGKTLVDCPYDDGPIELGEIDVRPLDGVISVSGSYDGKQIQSTISITGGSKIDAQWLARNAK